VVKMTLEENMSAAAEREKVLSILSANVRALSRLYRECFLSMGRGALLVYAERGWAVSSSSVYMCSATG